MSLLRAPGPTSEQRSSKNEIPSYGDALGFAHGAPPNLSGATAQRHGAVFASINFLADLISSLPIDTYRRDPRDPQGVAEPIANPPVIDEPAPDVDPISWRRQVIVSWLTQGNLFPLPVAYDDNMRPRLVQIIDPSDMMARRPGGKYSAITWVLNGKPMPQMMHWPAYTLAGEPIGLSPLGLAAATIGTGLSAQEFGRRWFLDGAHPSGVFTSDQPIDAKTAGKIKRRIMATLRGTREPLVLGAGLSFKPWSVPANESQFLETTQANIGDVARYFGLKATDIGGKSEDSMTYANVEQRGLDRLVYPVNPWLVKFEAFLKSLTPPDQFSKINRDAIVSVDLRTRTDVHVKRVQGGIASVDEVRAIDDLAPLPDGQGQQFVWPPMSTAPDAPAELDLSQLTPAQLQQLAKMIGDK